jgi:hypothetical protein
MAWIKQNLSFHLTMSIACDYMKNKPIIKVFKIEVHLKRKLNHIFPPLWTNMFKKVNCWILLLMKYFWKFKINRNYQFVGMSLSTQSNLVPTISHPMWAKEVLNKFLNLRGYWCCKKNGKNHSIKKWHHLDCFQISHKWLKCYFCTCRF